MVHRRTLDSDWSFRKVGEEDWRVARVPGHVHLDLMEHGIIPDPFVGTNEREVQWVDEEDWEYACVFDWHPHRRNDKQALVFHGLDTVCTILLNDEALGECDNMFAPFEIDVTGRLVEGDNELRIVFQSAARVARERKAQYLKENNLPETTASLYERAFVRKAQYMYGWDWGPTLVSCGVWKPVELVQYQSKIDFISSGTGFDEHGRADFAVNPVADGPGAIRCVLMLDGEVAGVLHAAENGWHRIVIDEPQIWWPHTMGDSPLYDLYTVLLPEDGSVELPDEFELDAWLEDVPAEVLDVRHDRIGLCRVQLEQVPDEAGSSFQFVVNGYPIYAMGANWIPDDSFPSRIDENQLFEKLNAAREMGMNMLRVWGGGIYETDTFYDICDELGILVWQDFPFACSYYPDGDAFAEEVSAEAEIGVARLRNHACLALWCGNNENHQVWHDGWGGKEFQPPRFLGEKLYHQVLPDAVEAQDQLHDYWPGSPYGGENPNAGGTGDQHYWDVWHGRGDWTFYTESTARFCSEFGFASAPSTQVWNYCAGGLDRSLTDEVVRWHDKTGKPWETFRGFITKHYPEPETLTDWIYYSQLNQRDAMREAIEHYRRSTFCKGTLIWQLNDCWPVQSWALIDSAGVWKAAAHEMVRLYDPILVSLEVGEGTVQVHVVNDTLEDVDHELTIYAIDLLSGSRRELLSTPFQLPAEGRAVIAKLPLEGFDRYSTLILAGVPGIIPTWRLLCEPKELRAASPTITAEAFPGYVEITTSGPALDIWLCDETGDARFASNFFSFLEAGTLRVDYAGELGNLVVQTLT